MSLNIFGASIGLIVVLIQVFGLAQGDFSIAAFNVQVFGQTKVSKPDVVQTIVKIIQRYDIILIQEIRDISETAIQILLDEVNEAGIHQYDMVVSERLGKSTSKEQYAFMYRLSDELAVTGTYQYPDPGDIFQREPFAARFSSTLTDVNDFVLAGIHTAPEDAVEEIDALAAVHQALQEFWGTDNILIMGDLNADCSYVGKKAKTQLILRTDATYHWLIGDDVDTTTSSTDCAYDRFVMTGEQFLSSVIPDSAVVFHYDAAYSLSLNETKAVSDHYPIELALQSATMGELVDPSSGASRPSSPWALVRKVFTFFVLVAAV